MTELSPNLKVIDVDIKPPAPTFRQRVGEFLVCSAGNPVLRVS